MEVSPSTVKEVVEKYLNAEVSNPQENFFSQGILDSFEAINLLITLEAEFGVKLEVLDFANNDNFKIDYIVDSIKKRRN